MHSKIRPVVCAVALFTAFALNGWAATNTWVAASDGNWNDANSWSNGVPAAGDAVVFDGTSVKNCTINSYPNNVATITVTSAYTGQITMAANVTTTGDVSIAGNWNCGGYVLSVGNDLTISGGAFNFGNGNSAVARDLTISGTPTYQEGTGNTVTIGRNLDLASTATRGVASQTWDCTGTGTITFNSNTSYRVYKLKCAAASQKTTLKSMCYARLHELGTGTMTAQNANNGLVVHVPPNGSNMLTNAGVTVDNSGGYWPYFQIGCDQWNQSCTFDGGNYGLGTFRFSNGTMTLVTRDFTCGMFYPTWGTVILGGYNLACATFAPTQLVTLTLGSSTIAVSGDVTLDNSGYTLSLTSAGSWTVGGKWDSALSAGTTALNLAGSTITFTGSSKTIKQKAGQAFDAVVVNASGAYTLNSAISAGNLTVTAGTLDTSSSSSYGLTVAGNVLINGGTLAANASAIGVTGGWSRTSGAFTYGTSSVTFNGTNGSRTISATGGYDFYNLTINGSGGTWTLGSNGAVHQDFAVDAGTVGFGNYDMTVTRDVSVNGGTYAAGTGNTLSIGRHLTIASGATPSGYGTQTWDCTGTGNVNFNGVLSRRVYKLKCAAASQKTTLTNTCYAMLFEFGTGTLTSSSSGYVCQTHVAPNGVKVLTNAGVTVDNSGGGYPQFTVGNDNSNYSCTFDGGNYGAGLFRLTTGAMTLVTRDLTCGAFYPTSGTFVLNGYNLTCSSWYASAGSTLTLTLGASTITVTGDAVFNDQGHTLSVSSTGSWSVGGKWDSTLGAGTTSLNLIGTLTFSGADKTITLKSGQSLGGVVVNTTGKYILSSDVSTGNFYLQAGTLVMDRRMLTVDGAFRNAGGLILMFGPGYIKHSSEDLRFTDSSGTTVTTYTAGNPGDTLWVTAEDQDKNLNTSVAETVTVVLTTPSGDSETVTLTETSASSGVFRNTSGIPTQTGTVSVANGTLEVQSGEDITVRYVDAEDPADIRVAKLGSNNAAPTAVASVSPSGSQTAPVKLTFTGSNSTDSDGTIVAYQWNFEDDSAGSTLANPTHVFEKPGTYHVTLVVTDNLGAMGTTSLTVQTTTAAPDAVNGVVMSADETRTSPGLVEAALTPGVVTASVTPSGGSAVSMMRLSPTRAYACIPLSSTAGTGYSMSLTGGTSVVVSGTLTWISTDLVTMNGQTLNIRKGDSLLLTGTGTGTTLEIDGDGDNTYEHSGAPGDKFAHEYATAGTYTAHAKIDGTVVGTLTVRVVDLVDFPEHIAAQVHNTVTRHVEFSVSPSAVASSAVVECYGDAALMSNTVTGGTLALEVGANGKAKSALTVRLASGEVPLVGREVVGFTASYVTNVYMPVVKRYANGDRLVGNTIQFDPVYCPGGMLRLTLIGYGTIFEQTGTINLDLDTSQADANGQINYYIVQSPGGACCHEFSVWDDDPIYNMNNQGTKLQAPTGEWKLCLTMEAKEEGKPDVPPEDCPCQWKDNDTCDSECYECVEIYGFGGDAPDSLPTRGERLHLNMKNGQYFGFNWPGHIGFGPHRALNYLARLQLAYDGTSGRFARVFDPQQMGTFSFEYDSGSGTYQRSYREYGFPADAYIEFTGTPNGMGVHPTATLYFPDGRSWTFEFEGYGTMTGEISGPLYRIVKRRTKEGKETNFTYNSGNVVIADASSHNYTCYYDLSRQITSISVNSQATWTYTYSGTSVTETNPRTGRTIQTTLDAEGRLLAQVEQGGGVSNSRYYYYDTSGNLTRDIENGVERTIAVSVNNELTTFTKMMAGKTKIAVYDQDGIRTKQVDPSGLNLTSTFTKNYYQRFLTRTDPNGKTKEFSYDVNGYMTYQSDADGVYTSYTYDSSCNLITKTTAAGSWRHEYDSSNRMTKQTAPDGGVSLFSYDSNGDMTRMTGPLGEKTDFEYNGSGQVTKKYGPYFGTTPPTEYVAYTYDSWGNLTRETDENGNYTAFEFDGGNRMTRRYCPVGCDTHYEYDGIGRKTKEIDATTAYTTWEYDSRGFVTRIAGSTSSGGGGCSSCGQASGSGGVLGSYYWDDGHLLTRFVDLNSHSTYHYYDGARRRTMTTDARSKNTHFAYDDADHLTTVTDAKTNPTTYGYSDAGRLTSVTNPLNETTTYYYNTSGWQTKVKDAMNAERLTAYDSMGRVTQVTDPISRSTGYAYDVGGNLTRMTDASGVLTDYAYDAKGLLTQTTRDVGTGKLNIVETRGYDPAERLTSVTDDLNHTTSYAYDTGNRLTLVTSELEKTTSYEYDPVGRQTRVADGAGRYVSTTYNAAGWVTQTSNSITSTSFCYDNVGNRTCVTVSGRAPVYFYYDDTNNLTQTSQTSGGVTIETFQTPDDVGLVSDSTDGEGKVTTYGYNEANRLISIENPLEEITTYEYDHVGRQTLVTFANSHTRGFAYDAAGQLTQTTGGPEGSKTYAYDQVGRQTSVTDANNKTRTTAYDALGRVTSQANEMSQAVTYAYDRASRMTALTDANSNTTNYEYNNDNQLTKMTYPAVTGEDPNEETYAYDNGGLLLTKVTCNGTSITYGYNGAGQRSSVNFGTTVSYGYDSAGAVTSITGLGSMSYAYDGFGRATLVLDGTGATTFAVNYAYDKRGLRTQLAMLDGTGAQTQTISYAYSDAGRLSTVQKNGENNQASYTYDGAGLRLTLAMPNNVGTTYGYDTNDRLTSLATGSLASFNVVRDNTGNISSITYADASISTFGYDSAYRLTQETRTKDSTIIYQGTLSYDAVGNRTRRESWNQTPYGSDASTKLLYHMEETPDSATAHDSSGKGHDGSVSGDATFVQNGYFGRALAFGTGSTGVITVSDHADLEMGTLAFTVEAYIKPDTIYLPATIISKWNDTAGAHSYMLSINSSGYLEGSVYKDSTDNAAIVSNGTLAANTWVHVAMQRVDGGTLQLYVGGVLQTQTASANYSLENNSEPVRIGAAGDDQDLTDEFIGLVDEVRISTLARGSDLRKTVTDYVYNARNQLVTATTGTSVSKYFYDPNGNQTKIEEWVDSVHLTAEDQAFGFDNLNRLTSYSGPRGSESYTYRGAEWHRASTTVDSVTTTFLYDGDNVLADIEGSTVKKFYVTPFLDQNLSMTITDGPQAGTYYYSQDWLGSVRTLTDSSGNLKNTYDYSGFGEKLSNGTNEIIENRVGYAGRTDFQHNPGMDYRYRTYAPGIGRWEERDPLKYIGNIDGNLYAYAYNMPVLLTDHYGFFAVHPPEVSTHPLAHEALALKKCQYDCLNDGLKLAESWLKDPQSDPKADPALNQFREKVRASITKRGGDPDVLSRREDYRSPSPGQLKVLPSPPTEGIYGSNPPPQKDTPTDYFNINKWLLDICCKCQGDPPRLGPDKATRAQLIELIARTVLHETAHALDTKKPLNNRVEGKQIEGAPQGRKHELGFEFEAEVWGEVMDLDPGKKFEVILTQKYERGARVVTPHARP